ncbi:hypothetical protein WJX84_010928 [Apatococcus fuscideae]|uniref:serine C-palmitoyltransferase n=1 Tax=Apatococcus fuscideae TaxID=2026836 RepID=A0AAW1TBZ1_9CHLO
MAKGLLCRKPLNRRFVVIEGVYAGSGDIAPMDEIFKLKEEFCYRLVVDESNALGVLGKRGRGACEHFGLEPEQVEIVTATMGNALSSVGGFCCGNHEMVDHQRLSGLGYCFSASLPPYLATAAIGALDVLESRWDPLREQLQHNAKTIRSMLADIQGLRLLGSDADALSAVIHLQPSNGALDAQQIVSDLLESGVCISCQERSCLEIRQRPPTIRVVVTAAHEPQDLQQVADALRRAAQHLQS